MLLKDLIFTTNEKIHRKNNIKPYTSSELCIYYSDELGLIILPKNQIDKKNDLILPTSADLLIKYNYKAVCDIELNLLSLNVFIDTLYPEDYEFGFEHKLTNFFIRFFSA